MHEREAWCQSSLDFLDYAFLDFFNLDEIIESNIEIPQIDNHERMNQEQVQIELSEKIESMKKNFLNNIIND